MIRQPNRGDLFNYKNDWKTRLCGDSCGDMKICCYAFWYSFNYLKIDINCIIKNDIF